MYVWLRGADLLDMKSSPPWERLDTLAMFSVCLLHSSRLSFSVFRFFVFSFLFFHFSVIIWKSENLKIWLVFFYMYLFFCFLFSFGCCACCVTTPSGLSTSSLHHSSPTSHDRTIQKKTVASHEAAVAKYTLVYNLSFRCTNHSWQRVVTLLPPVGQTLWLFAAIVTSSFLHCIHFERYGCGSFGVLRLSAVLADMAALLLTQALTPHGSESQQSYRENSPPCNWRENSSHRLLTCFFHNILSGTRTHWAPPQPSKGYPHL